MSENFDEPQTGSELARRVTVETHVFSQQMAQNQTAVSPQ
ncbi:hypothetical protein D4764_16G0000850 [Takifugu flavidus]|uniref:Uncharacterized protein n=1 Tax=Takifugu flavidus TaxID=433684 RepID=A0A5C6NXP2_9TELE|nr:hypothetical protein D4764_16G0000850 [Takifugu flavidus]